MILPLRMRNCFLTPLPPAFRTNLVPVVQPGLLMMSSRLRGRQVEEEQRRRSKEGRREDKLRERRRRVKEVGGGRKKTDGGGVETEGQEGSMT